MGSCASIGSAKRGPDCRLLLREGVLVVFLLSCLASLLTLLLRPTAGAIGGWADGMALGFAGLALLQALARQLPWQNVSVVIFLLALAATGLFLGGNLVGWTAGRLSDPGKHGPGSFTLPPWPFLAMWVICIVNGYGVAQRVLRRWRADPHYGWWLIGLSSGLAAALAVILEAFAVEVRGYWPQSPNVAGAWLMSTCISLAGRFGVALASLLLANPWLIDKRGIERPPDSRPLLVALALGLLCGIGFFS